MITFKQFLTETEVDIDEMLKNVNLFLQICDDLNEWAKGNYENVPTKHRLTRRDLSPKMISEIHKVYETGPELMAATLNLLKKFNLEKEVIGEEPN